MSLIITRVAYRLKQSNSVMETMEHAVMGDEECCFVYLVIQYTGTKVTERIPEPILGSRLLAKILAIRFARI